MAKNKKKKAVKNSNQKPLENQEVQNVEVAEQVEPKEVEQQKQNKPEQKQEKKQKQDKKAKKPTLKEKGQNKVKESVAELKKVTWPTFPKVVKNTLLVLGIVLIFTLVLFGIDFGLSQIYKLITPAA